MAICSVVHSRLFSRLICPLHLMRAWPAVGYVLRLSVCLLTVCVCRTWVDCTFVVVRCCSSFSLLSLSLFLFARCVNLLVRRSVAWRYFLGVALTPRPSLSPSSLARGCLHGGSALAVDLCDSALCLFLRLVSFPLGRFRFCCRLSCVFLSRFSGLFSPLFCFPCASCG